MCYAKPGPRCNSSAQKRLAAAEAAFAQEPSKQNKALVQQRKADFYLTSNGIDMLRAQGRDDLADYFQEKRDRLIRESKFLSMRANRGKWGSVPLKEMDAGALSQAALEIVDDDTIDWGTSSPQDFVRAINAATFWHMNQTRANRAGYPRTPYIEHPLRNVLRAYRWGCTDGETLTSIVLHDTVEDCSEKIILRADLPKYETRELAYQKLNGIFGKNVKGIVAGMTNPIYEGPERTREQKNQAYCDHLRETIYDPKVFIGKFADFSDNAGGLHHNYIKGQEGMVAKMYVKYDMAMPIFRDAYDKIKDELPMGSRYQIHLTIAKVESNLQRLGQRLREDGQI